MSKINFEHWEPYKIGDIFKITKGKRLTKENMISGYLNYLGAISENNAVREKIQATPLHKGNCITVNYNGSVGEAFYQKEPFWATDDINILDLKDYELTENIGLFICTVIKHNKYRFSYGRKWTMEKMKDSIIYLPSKDGKPDFDYMDKYIQNLNINHIATNNKKNGNMIIDPYSWEWVYLKDIFKINRTDNINYDLLSNNGETPYVTRTTLNNGVEKFVDSSGYFVNKGNAIIIGGESATAFYQNDDFLTGNNITLLTNDKLNKYNGLFIVAVLNKEKFKYSYGRAFNTKNIANTKIKLPFKNGQVDWNYMETYIKLLPYADKI